MKIAALPLGLGMPFLAAFFAPASAQQGVPTTIVGVKGTCENISLAGTPARCAPGAGVIYSVLPNGRVLITFPLADGRVASFVGEKDSQPRPEQYFLYLSRIRIVSNGTEFAAKLAGQCVVDMSRDGKIWLLVNCTATDENSEAYSFQFRGDGTPVDVKHPGASPQGNRVKKSSTNH
jgi:hypothetical protein